jgi:DNA-binding NtrC family response regulator
LNEQASSSAQFGVIERLVGRSEALQEIRTLIRRVAGTKISVLITGESGTGKDVVATMIHDLSPRRDKPFVSVNCGAIPEGLFESEMFGHERGSFTGAERQRKGYFEQADGGTLFLDEVGEMPLAMQVKVLRALESGEFLRVGGSRSLHADVRVLAATNRELARDVQKGHFREDLYFRLKAVEITIPPLRERPEDIPPLVERFAEEFARENNFTRPRIMPRAMEALQNHPWRGNARELRNFIGTLLTLEREGPIDTDVVYRHLPREMGREGQPPNLPVPAPLQRQELDSDLILQLLLDMRRELQEVKGMLTQVLALPHVLPERASYIEENGDFTPPTLEELEKQQIQQTLQETNGNRRKAAKLLGIGERTLYRKIKEYGL